MLLTFVVLYLIVTVAIGFMASGMVKNAEDFILAGRRLPLVLSASALFATWFGSETVLGASSEFIKHGLYGVIEDPFGAALCLLLVGIFFARPLYKMNILTFGDFYRIKFSRSTELVSSIFMIPSYFGWIAAQLVALGIIFNVLSGLPVIHGIIVSALLVAAYTFVGGLWAISVTDFMQTVIIIAGLGILAFSLVDQVGGLQEVVAKAPNNFFRFLPEPDLKELLYYFAAWITIGLGSIPSQDVFQRVMSARTEKIAVRSSYIASGMYISIALLPLIIGLCARILYPDLLDRDEQTILPAVVLLHSHLAVQVLFFGALLSAIMSTTSAAILAPASILAENLIKPLIKSNLSAKHHLLLLRICVLFIAVVATVMAGYSSNIYLLVGEASSLSLVSLFIPLIAGLYWKKANSTGAIASMFSGLVVWALFENMNFDIPSLIPGLTASALAMYFGSSISVLRTK